jgi:peroxiredoxin
LYNLFSIKEGEISLRAQKAKKGLPPMVRTASTMVALGTQAPEFHLPDVTSGQIVSLESFATKSGLLVMFICRHCPYVKHIQDELARIGRDYQSRDVGIVAISSNDIAQQPEDAPESLKSIAQELGFTFPFCYDESQAIAKAYGASCTPDFFLFDSNRRLVYRGQLDDSRPGKGLPVTGRDLRAALDALLAGQPVSRVQKASLGCNIKWKPGNEPAY